MEISCSVGDSRHGDCRQVGMPCAPQLARGKLAPAQFCPEKPRNLETVECGAGRCAVWWGRKAALVEHHDGITANGSFALDMALTELPSFYKKRAHEVHGEHYVDEDGRVRSVPVRACFGFRD